MTRNIKGMITMKNVEAPHHRRRCLALALAGCASTRRHQDGAKSRCPTKRGTGRGAGTERETISTAGAEQIIPKEKKRDISADARADFEKAMKRYQAAKKSRRPVAAPSARSVSDAFKRVADDNPGAGRGALQPGRGAATSAAARTTRRASGRACKYGPAITNLGYIAWKNNDAGPGRVAVQARDRGRSAAHASRRATTWRRSCATRRARPSSSEEKKSYVGQAVSNLRTVLALDSNNLQAFSTLAFIYYDMNMLEMAKLVGNQAIKKADEIATGKFEEEKVEEAAEGKAGKGEEGQEGEEGEGREDGDEDEASWPRRSTSARPAPASPPT